MLNYFIPFNTIASLISVMFENYKIQTAFNHAVNETGCTVKFYRGSILFSSTTNYYDWRNDRNNHIDVCLNTFLALMESSSFKVLLLLFLTFLYLFNKNKYPPMNVLVQKFRNMSCFIYWYKAQTTLQNDFSVTTTYRTKEEVNKNFIVIRKENNWALAKCAR